MSVESSERIKKNHSIKIISASKQLLLARGNENVTMAEIAAAAGVVKRTVINIFGTKNNLMICVLTALFGDLLGILDDKCADEAFCRMTGMEQVIELHAERAKYYRDHPGFVYVIQRVEMLEVRGAMEAESCTAYLRKADAVYDYYKAPLQKGWEDGSIRRDLDEKMAHDVLFFSFGTVAQHLSVIQSNDNIRPYVDTFGTMQTILYATRKLLAASPNPSENGESA